MKTIEENISELERVDRFITHNPTDYGDSWLEASNAIDEAINVLRENKPKTCKFIEEEGYWECTNCKNAWSLEEGNPIDNGMIYCTSCGAEITSIIETQFDYEFGEEVEIETECKVKGGVQE